MTQILLLYKIIKLKSFEMKNFLAKFEKLEIKNMRDKRYFQRLLPSDDEVIKY